MHRLIDWLKDNWLDVQQLSTSWLIDWSIDWLENFDPCFFLARYSCPSSLPGKRERVLDVDKCDPRRNRLWHGRRNTWDTSAVEARGTWYGECLSAAASASPAIPCSTPRAFCWWSRRHPSTTNAWMPRWGCGSVHALASLVPILVQPKPWQSMKSQYWRN